MYNTFLELYASFSPMEGIMCRDANNNNLPNALVASMPKHLSLVLRETNDKSRCPVADKRLSW